MTKMADPDRQPDRLPNDTLYLVVATLAQGGGSEAVELDDPRLRESEAASALQAVETNLAPSLFRTKRTAEAGAFLIDLIVQEYDLDRQEVVNRCWDWLAEWMCGTHLADQIDWEDADKHRGVPEVLQHDQGES